MELDDELQPTAREHWAHVAGQDDETEGFMGEDDMDVDLKPDALQIPTYLKRVFSAMGEGARTPAMTLLLAVHAALLESGLMPAWTVCSCRFHLQFVSRGR